MGQVIIEVPVGGEVAGRCGRHVDARLSLVQARALQGVLDGLVAQEARLFNGKLVLTRVDAVRWLLEEVAGEGDEGEEE